MFDKPVEHAVEWVFHKAFEVVGGPAAVGSSPDTGRQEIGQKQSERGAQKEKEL